MSTEKIIIPDPTDPTAFYLVSGAPRALALVGDAIRNNSALRTSLDITSHALLASEKRVDELEVEVQRLENVIRSAARVGEDGRGAWMNTHQTISEYLLGAVERPVARTA